MQDIRLLKLFKQHYQDKFEVPLSVKYSSWGYYDGFEVIQADDMVRSRLFTKESESPFSTLYYGAGEEIAKLNAGKSLQIIGLFRCSDNLEDEIQHFWEMADKLPYFAIGFLKIGYSYTELEDSARDIESCFNRQFDAQTEKGCLGLTYFTYDNADLIVLLTGNSIEYMMGILQEIEKKSFISYMHNIFGVAEKLLQTSSDSTQIIESLEGSSCYIGDEIACIEMKFVTSGDWQHILKGLKKTFEQENETWKIKGYEKITYTYISGHENLILKLKGTDVRSLLALLTPNGFLTHQNVMYENGVYNIETSIFLKEESWECIPDSGEPEPDKKFDKKNNAWCERLIRKYSNYISVELKAGDEGFYAYFQSLLLTLNTLNQYERFRISRDLFLMIYPALKLFDEMFSEVYEKIKQEECVDYERIGKLKDVLCNFITNINSVIYHTIHTDQVFLMIPGYSGTSYSIPIKLNIMYYWFMDSIKNILNDGDINCQCILVPNMEANPKTRLFDFGMETKGSLIYVSFSQRTLFLPKNLMIILAHEVAHYVGQTIRIRESRWRHILTSVSGCIVESIMCGVSHVEPQEQEYAELYREYTEYVSENLDKEITRYLKVSCEMEIQGDYHGEKIAESLKKGIYQMITLKNGNIEEVITKIPESIDKKLKDDEKFYEYSNFIYELRKSMLGEFQGMAYNSWMSTIVDMLMYTYREVFSDMAALSITQCDFQDFREAYQVSEGIKISDENASPEQCVRELAANQVVYGNKEKIYFYGLGKEDEEPYIVKNLYTYEKIRKEIIQYADECYQAIMERMKQPEQSTLIVEVRKVFCIFKGREANDSIVQREINSVIQQYMQKIERKYADEYKSN